MFRYFTDWQSEMQCLSSCFANSSRVKDTHFVSVAFPRRIPPPPLRARWITPLFVVRLPRISQVFFFRKMRSSQGSLMISRSLACRFNHERLPAAFFVGPVLQLPLLPLTPTGARCAEPGLEAVVAVPAQSQRRLGDCWRHRRPPNAPGRVPALAQAPDSLCWFP